MFLAWLSRVLTYGESVLAASPSLLPEERPRVVEALRAAFEQHALDVAGPPIPFDPEAALRSAIVLARACWRFVGPDEDTPSSLDLGVEPSSPSAHLSVDVALRFLPAVYRRSRLREPEIGLTAELDGLLRRWPLSGVLADLDGEPATPPEFGGHCGLQLLYAERLVATGRPGWVPKSGPAREWVERVYQERGKPMPAPLPKEEASV
jgi:MoxR-vWA-beta-propeller ternary system domain bpX4